MVAVATWSNCAHLHPAAWSAQHMLEDWFLAMTDRGTKAAQSLAILTQWQIWKQRNAVVFNGNRKPEHAVFAEIKDECSTWIAAGKRVLSTLKIAQRFVSNQLVYNHHLIWLSAV